MSSEITIRHAMPGEDEDIHEAHMRSIREICVKDHGDEIKGWGFREENGRWRQSIMDNRVWVVVKDDKIEGLGCIGYESPGKPAKVYALYLTPEVVKTGSGSKLLEIMEIALRKRGTDIVELESSKTARQFYKSHGYEETGPEQPHVINGHPVTCVPMRKRL